MARSRKGEKKRNRDRWSTLLATRLPWLLIVPLGFAIPAIASQNPHEVERVYSQSIYPAVRTALSAVSSLFSFSLAELLLIIAVLSIAAVVIIRLIQLVFRKIRVVRFFRTIFGLAILGGVLLNTFYFAWGINHFRPRLNELMNLSQADNSVEQLSFMCEVLSNDAAEIRKNLYEDSEGVFALKDGPDTHFDLLPQAYAALSKDHPIFEGELTVVKSVHFSEALSSAGIAGMFMPYTSEANVNVDQPALLLLSSAAHEMAHQLGFAREDEANFIAYLACTYSQDASTQYSGIMLALINCANRLYREDPDLYYELYSSFSEQIQRDINAYNKYWLSFEGPLEDTMGQVNDSYLKFNQQGDSRSYNEMVTLLMAYYYG